MLGPPLNLPWTSGRANEAFITQITERSAAKGSGRRVGVTDVKQNFFAVHTTPAMTEQLTQLTNDTLQLLQDRTQSPEEALIVLDAVVRTLEAAYGVKLIGPMIDDKSFGQA